MPGFIVSWRVSLAMLVRDAGRVRRLVRCLAAAMILVCAGTSARAELRIGAGSADITPDPVVMRVTIGGYARFLGHRAEGVHDPVFAKAVVFESKGAIAALVAIDLVEVSRDIREEVLKRLAGTVFNHDNVFLCATHTHAAPGAVENHFVAGLVFGPYSKGVVDVIADGIVIAIKAAERNVQASRLRIAENRAPGLTRNRRVAFYDYSSRRFSRKYDPKTEPPADDTITVLRADDIAGKPIAILVHFASHATTLGPGNSLLSADWPGVMRREIEARYPGVVVLYLNGAEGDLAPDVTDGSDDYQAMELFGTRVARAAAPLIDRAKAVQAEPFAYKIAWLDAGTPARVGRIRIPSFLVKSWLRKMPFSAIRLGDVVLLGAPFEATSSIGLEIKSAARAEGYPHAVYIGIMNQYCGYATTPAEYRAGGYEARYTLFGERTAGLITGKLGELARELKTRKRS